MKRISMIIVTALLSFTTVQAQELAGSMSELLQQIERGQARDSEEARQREAKFLQRKNEQQNLLDEAIAERKRQES